MNNVKTRVQFLLTHPVCPELRKNNPYTHTKHCLVWVYRKAHSPILLASPSAIPTFKTVR